ncbi:MAG: hypothetical protein R3B72_41395 [Polyangiaceae bacterium]
MPKAFPRSVEYEAFLACYAPVLAELTALGGICDFVGAAVEVHDWAADSWTGPLSPLHRRRHRRPRALFP